MYLEIAIFVLVGGFIILLVSTALLEKQPIRDFVPVSGAQLEGDSPYFTAMNEAARRLGFKAAGEFVQARSSRLYRARIALWISSDGQILLRVAGGKTAGIAVKRSTVLSLVEPNLIIETADDFGTSDLSGLTQRKVMLNGDLDELLTTHRERLAACPGVRRVFSASQALAAYEAMQSLKAEEMERIGLGKFLDGERTVWRHTLKGAWLTYFKGFRSQMAEAKAQMNRSKLKRPGQK